MKWFVFLMSLVVVCMPSQAQTIAAATPWVNPQFLDCSGTACVPLNGGNLYTYVSNTTTPQATCASSQISGGACVTPNTNPVSIGSLGYNAAGSGSAGIWLVPGLVYRFVLKNSAGTTIWTQDGVGLAVVPIASGGTVQTTKAAGFNSLSPTSATGEDRKSTRLNSSHT